MAYLFLSNTEQSLTEERTVLLSHREVDERDGCDELNKVILSLQDRLTETQASFQTRLLASRYHQHRPPALA
jgi:hypothetical protein